MQESNGTETLTGRAAIFIDYANLHDAIVERTTQPDESHEIILDLIEILRSKFSQRTKHSVTTISAYADFSEFVDQTGSIQQLLYLHGIEPRFVSRSLQPNAPEIQLAVDVIETLHSRPEIETFIFVSGNRPHLPLLQAVQRQSRSARLVLFEEEPLDDTLPTLRGIVLNASDLISRTPRRLRSSTGQRSSDGVSTTNGHVSAPADHERTIKAHQRITNALCLEALQLIDDHFGQYEEIYLTPLLRKMSEDLGSEAYDPKSIVSELEESGAVWLEKRRGFPHDYTVLLIDEQHPDVLAIKRDSSIAAQDVFTPDYDFESTLRDERYD